MRKPIVRNLQRTSHRVITASVLFSMVVLAVNPGGGCQNSWTPKPHCPPGWYADRAPSHQGHIWDCVQVDTGRRVPNGVFTTAAS